MKSPLGVLLAAVVLVAFALEDFPATGDLTRHEDIRDSVAALTGGGNAERGRDLVAAKGCISCHVIPGVRGADGNVGPSLDRIATRIYIAGVRPNTPENMIRWINDPPAVDPLTAMPDLHLNDADIRDIAAFLYTLR
jgi:cytochrome c